MSQQEEAAFQTVSDSMMKSAWGSRLQPQYIPALARDVLYDLDQAGWAVIPKWLIR